MINQSYPGIVITEKDASVYNPSSVPTSIGAIAGPFQWGPVKEIRTVTNEQELVSTFWKPNNATAEAFFSATNFLAYSGNLRVVRALGATGLNATTGATGVLVENETDYTENHSSGISGTTWVAKYPGALGNSLKVSICDAEKFASWAYKSYFDSAPGTSTYAANIFAGANDELHVAVIDEDGLISGTAGTVLEVFPFVSKASDAKTITGESNYYKDVINLKSEWIWWGNHTTGATAPGTAWGSVVPGATGFATFGATGPITQSLQWGVAGETLSTGEEIAAFDLFKDEEVKINFIITGGASSTAVEDVIDNIAEVRKDLVVCVSPPKAAVVDNKGQEVADITTYRNSLNSSTYVIMDSGWKYQYDKYNDAYRWIPLNADLAGLCARTEAPWVSPAGLTRGFVKNVKHLAWSPSKTAQGDLYKIGVVSVINKSGQGVVLWGDKVMTSKPSALDRINVRRLFLALQDSIKTAAEYTLFELNDVFTRSQFTARTESFLREVKGRGGLYDFMVVCDETNNTAQVIDSNSFVGDIYLKPAKSISWVRLNFWAVGNSVKFTEIIAVR